MIKTRLVTQRFPHTADSVFWKIYDKALAYYWRNEIYPTVDIYSEYSINGMKCHKKLMAEYVVRVAFEGKNYFVDSHLRVHEIL